MQPGRLVLRGLAFYWRTHAAVVLGVATAVAVLAGALLVGDSVRGSLRDLLLMQLGRTDRIVVSTGFFREALGEDLQKDDEFGPAFDGICPLIVAQGLVTEQASGRRASRVAVYGVDERFWRFHGLSPPRNFDDRTAFVSRALASDIGAAAGGTVLVRIERPTDIPLESLHGRKDDRGHTLRLTIGGIAGSAELGEFSLRPQQGEVRAVFVALKRLQDDLDLNGRVNTLLVSDRTDLTGGSKGSALRTVDVPRAGSFDPPGTLEALVRRRAALDDLGLTVRPIESRGVLALESAAGVLDEARANAADRAAAQLGTKAQPVFTYLANSLRSGSREIPYSLVAATDLGPIAGRAAVAGWSTPPPIVINDWTARNLGVRVGDPLTLEYYVWEEPGRLLMRTADFRIAAVVPIEGAAADRDLAPVYPGITDSETLGDWDPPFPIDLRRVRPSDEDYWKKYRTTPKAFIPFAAGQTLWRSRYGDRTSVRIAPAPGDSLIDISRTSAFSSCCRRCCSRHCSSGSAWSSGRAKSACFARSDIPREPFDGFSSPRDWCWPRLAARSASPARWCTRL
jgi:putative ABC transport system permease protein